VQQALATGAHPEAFVFNDELLLIGAAVLNYRVPISLPFIKPALPRPPPPLNFTRASGMRDLQPNGRGAGRSSWCQSPPEVIHSSDRQIEVLRGPHLVLESHFVARCNAVLAVLVSALETLHAPYCGFDDVSGVFEVEAANLAPFLPISRPHFLRPSLLTLRPRAFQMRSTVPPAHGRWFGRMDGYWGAVRNDPC